MTLSASVAGEPSHADILRTELDKLRADFRQDLKQIVQSAVREVLREESQERAILKQQERQSHCNEAAENAPSQAFCQTSNSVGFMAAVPAHGDNGPGVEEALLEVEPQPPGTSPSRTRWSEPEENAGNDKEGLPEVEAAPRARRLSQVSVQSSTMSTWDPNRSTVNPVSTGTAKEIRLFGDMDKFLSSMEEASQYNVCDFYKTTGISQALARNEFFGNLTLFVISCNGVYLGIDSDRNNAASLAEADISFQVCEHLFCVFFTFELLVRFFAFYEKRNCFRDFWFTFDTILVVVMVLETWVLPVVMDLVQADISALPTGPLKLLRLARLARMARILRSLPELVTMIKGMLVATRAVGSAMLLLIGAIYAFAILLFTLLKENHELGGYWDTLTVSMSTLLCNGVFGDSIGTVVRLMIDTNEIPAIAIFFMFVTIAAVTVMNMLIGVLCEVVGAVAAHEKEQADRSAIKSSLAEMLSKVDEDGSGELDKTQVLRVINDAEALETLIGLDVDVGYFAGMLDMLFEETPQISIDALIKLIMEFRGQCEANLQDVINCHDYTRWILKTELRQLWLGLASLEDCLKQQTKSIRHTRAYHMQGCAKIAECTAPELHQAL